MAETARQLAAGHLVPLARGWAVERSFCLRGAGFPAAKVLGLAISDFDRKLAALTAGGGARAARKALRRARRQPRPAAGELKRLERASAAAAEAERDFAQHLASEEQRIRDALRQQAREDRFREALVWQNRRVLNGALAALLRQPADATHTKARQNEQLVASYLQRYCLKNESIGFFGPIGWGTFRRHGPAIELRPGDRLLAERRVYFEHWAVESFAAKLVQNPALRPWLRPRRAPYVRLAGEILHHPIDRHTRLPSRLAQLLAAADGMRTAGELARGMVAAGGARSEEEVCSLLAQLEKRGLILWTLEIPTGVDHPEQLLRRQLQEIEDNGLRGASLAALARLEAGKRAVARAAGDAARLETAMKALERAFEQSTAGGSTRRAGKMYAGRSIVYEDCRRDAELRIGAPLLAQIGPPLALILTAARWFSHAIAARYRDLFGEVYRQLQGPGPAEAVDCGRFLSQVDTHLAPDQYRPSPVVRLVIDELHARWARLLDIPPDSREAAYSAGQLAAGVEEAFAAPGPGWPMARYHSPDLLIAASDVEAIRRGEWTAVLGELHPTCNTLLMHALIAQHPNPHELSAGLEATVGEGCIAPVLPKEEVSRASYMSPCPSHFHLELGRTRSPRPRPQVIEVSQLVVEETAGQLVVRSRCGSHRFDIIAFFEHYLIGGAGHFSLMPSAPHTPRLRIDDLVVARQRWRFAPEELRFARPDQRQNRLLMANRWAQRHGLPRFVFVSIPEERKPVYVDFHSPIYVEMLAKMTRKASVVQLTEMLPRHDQTWLTDGEGATYTCELRIAAVDPLPWSAPGPTGTPRREPR